MKVKVKQFYDPTEKEIAAQPQPPLNIQGRQIFLREKDDSLAFFTGETAKLLIIVVLPDAQYAYFKIEMRCEKHEFGKEIINVVPEHLKDIRKGKTQLYFIFEFVPKTPGKYRVSVEAAFLLKTLGNSPPQSERRDQYYTNIDCRDSLEIIDKIVYEDRPGSVGLPLLLNYTLTNKMNRSALKVELSFQSEEFDFKPLHTEDTIVLGPLEIYYLIYELRVKNVSRYNKFGGTLLGVFRAQYRPNETRRGSQKEGAVIERKTLLEPNDKAILLCGESITKSLPKKNIATLKVRFSKAEEIRAEIFSNIRISVHENENPSIKILKLSKDRLDLNSNSHEDVEISLICLNGGFVHLKGIELKTGEKIINYTNNLTFFVQNESEKKEDLLFQQTTTIYVDLI